MALVKCNASVGANIAMNCDSPIVSGWEATGVMFNRQDIDTITRSAANPRIITAITLKSDAKTIAVYNPVANPFDGSQDEASVDGLYPVYNKTVALNIPLRGAAASKDIVEPLLKNRDGFVVILPAKDHSGDGSFVAFGTEQGLMASAQTRNNTDAAQSGVWNVTLVESGCQFAEVVLFDTSYALSKTEFDTLLALSY